MAIRKIVFDMEGTILGHELEEIHFEAFRLAAAAVGVFFDPDNIVADMASKIPNAIGGGDRTNCEGIWRLSSRQTSVEEIMRLKKSLYGDMVERLESIAPRPGFLEVFEAIRRLGLKVAIASLTPRNQAEVLLERSGVGKLFKGHPVLLEDFGGKAKPAPDVYLEAARRLGIRPDEQFVFEDSPSGVKAAHAAGSPVIAMPIFTFPENLAKLREAGALKIFFSWEEVNIVQLLRELNS